MSEAFSKHMTPRQINVKGNYVKSELRMAIRSAESFINNNNQHAHDFGNFQLMIDDSEQE